jgi:hypothetical protein
MVSRSPKKTNDRWSQLSRTELVALGRNIVRDRLESIGSTVKAPNGRGGSKLEVETPSGRPVEVFISTQRDGGYAFWTKRRFQPASDRFAAIVVLGDADEPGVYLVPSTEWRNASPPLTDRPNIGKRSEPEYGISLARSSLPALQRYKWDERSGRELFR